MKTLVRNFTSTFRRFFTASVLNIIGLAIAFASFFIIMTQVIYDLSYNKGYKDYENIYRVEIYPNQDYGWQTWVPRPLAEAIGSSTPHIKAVSIVSSFSFSSDYQVGEHLFNETTLSGFGNFMDVFQPRMIAGSADALNQELNVLIPRSMAMRFFGTVDAVGKNIQSNMSGEHPLVVGGVFEDFPENSQLGNYLYFPLPTAENKDNWQNWNYNCYLRTDGSLDISALNELVLERLSKLLPEILEDDGDDTDFVRMTRIDDVHFSKVGNKSAGSRSTVYLLICVSFLIVLVAAVNFMNFSLAETPMRIKSINTQKVMGASTGSLRFSLALESVLISVFAFGISLLLIYLLRGTFVQELVTANLNLAEHPYLLVAVFGISLLIGVLAGIYPAYYATSFPPALVLKGSFGLSPKGRKLRMALVCFQFFVSFMLIISIGIMYSQSRYIRTSDYGYDKDAIIVGRMTSETKGQLEAVRDELSRIKGVEGVAFSQFVLSSADDYMGWGRGEGEQALRFDVLPVDCQYLDLMGIRITEGRSFRAGDGDVYVFNEAARTKYPWLAVGKPATTGDFPVVGFCENINYSTFRNDDAAQPMAFFIYGKAYETWGAWQNWVNVRVSAGTDKIEIIRSLQKAMEKFVPGHDFNFRYMDQVLDSAYRNELRFTRQVLLFSLLAIVISIIGVFGLTMFESEYRRKEIGIRKIMGSSTASILFMFNRRYLGVLVGCFIVSVPFGWWIGQHWLQDFAVQVPIGPFVFIVSFLAVSLVTLLTVTFQCWKNAHENPVNSIKTE